MSGFSDPILTGSGNLIRVTEQSDNFLTGTSGWQITRSGNAEFNQITIRGGVVENGAYLLYSGTPAHGNLVLSLSAAAGTDSFGNTYVAGLGMYGATGQTIAQLLPSAQSLVLYSADGSSLIGMVAQSSATELEFGVGTGFSGGALIASKVGVVGNLAGSVSLDSPANASGGNAASISLISDTPTGGPNSQIELTATTTLITGTAKALQPGSGSVESWHNVSGGVGFASTEWTDAGSPYPQCSYKLLPDGWVGIRGRIMWTSNGVTGLSASGTAIFTLPTGYQPAFEHTIPVGVFGSNPTLATNRVPVLEIAKTGVVTVFEVAVPSTNGNSGVIAFTGKFPLD